MNKLRISFLNILQVDVKASIWTQDCSSHLYFQPLLFLQSSSWDKMLRIWPVWFLFAATANGKKNWFSPQTDGFYKSLSYVYEKAQFPEKAHSKPTTSMEGIFGLKFAKKLPKILSDKLIWGRWSEGITWKQN